MFRMALLVLIVLQSHVSAWWDSSHMIVAQIAKNHLTERASFHSDELISLFSPYHPTSADFITASCWADDIKDSLLDFSSWHKQLMPHDPDQILSMNEKEQLIVNAMEKGLNYGIKKCIEILKNSNTNYYDKGIALRLLIHLVADAHMPLHCITLYNELFPKGDKGGSLFLLKDTFRGKIDNLHALWDSCIMLDCYEFKRPLTINGKNYIEHFAQELALRFPKELLVESTDLEVNHWTQESYHLGVEVVYQDIQPFSQPSAEYLNKSTIIACQQLTLAGYRLSNLLNEIFEDYK